MTQYQLKPVKNMTEDHLCNTITCYNPHITAERKQQCKQELIRRWTSPSITRTTSTDSVINSVIEEVVRTRRSN